MSFGKNLVRLHPGSGTSELATVYSLTNTLLANLPEVRRVRILIDEKEAESIRGHISLKKPFVFNPEIVAPAARAG